VDGGAHTQPLALDGAGLLDPGMGRTMKEWMLAPAIHASRWPEPAESSLRG
jgi:hypothetical protein